MKTNDLKYLYEWAAETEFPLRRAPTAVGYSNKDIYFCWLKALTNNGGGVRESVVRDQRARDILKSDEILVATIALFESGTELGPHKDPPVYDKKYRRIQIPLHIPSEDCYMIWRGRKVFWKEGKPQIFDVMDYVHEGYNYSPDDMIFLFIDIVK
jgi:hypothetical protein|tara:strand:+ start:325 stop:789 length:465 start_codon:yes stop_codon:yes gene_type:complete